MVRRTQAPTTGGRRSGARAGSVAAPGKRSGGEWPSTGRLAARLLVLVLGLALLAWLSLLAGRLVRGSESFRLAALEVEGLRVVTGNDVLAATGLAQNDNVFAVDLRAVRDRVESLPWVKRAVVTRRPPDRLSIRLLERRRVAWINLGRVYGIDRDGVLLPGERVPGEDRRELDLPVISGLGPPDGAAYPGMVVTDSALVRVLDWWRQASAADSEFCLNVSEIQPLPGDGVRLLLVGDGLEVRMPTGQVAERLQVLEKLIARVYRECPDPAYIDMRYAGQVVVGSKERNPG